MQDQGDIVPLKHRSTSATYIRARLRRDAPDVAALVGEKIIATFAELANEKPGELALNRAIKKS